MASSAAAIQVMVTNSVWNSQVTWRGPAVKLCWRASLLGGRGRPVQFAPVAEARQRRGHAAIFRRHQEHQPADARARRLCGPPQDLLAEAIFVPRRNAHAVPQRFGSRRELADIRAFIGPVRNPGTLPATIGATGVPLVRPAAHPSGRSAYQQAPLSCRHRPRFRRPECRTRRRRQETTRPLQPPRA